MRTIFPVVKKSTHYSNLNAENEKIIQISSLIEICFVFGHWLEYRPSVVHIVRRPSIVRRSQIRRGVAWRRTSPQQLFKLYQRFLDFILYIFYISTFHIFKLYFLGESPGGRLRLNNCSNHTKGFSKQVSSNCMYTRAMFCANYTPHVITHEWQKFSLVKLEIESRYDCY